MLIILPLRLWTAVAFSSSLMFGAPPGAATLKGRVEDTSGSAVAGATIIVACAGDARNAKSGDDGRFEVLGLAPGRCSISAWHRSFTPTAIDVTIPDDGSVSSTVVLPVRALEEDVVVTATRGSRERIDQIPAGVSVVTDRDLSLRPYQVLPQALREETGVAVQQTTAAAGSPIIRGFTGQANVYLLDGVRLNTSAWRSGPSQYLAWLSPASIERIEVVRGPMSVQYGSDALGGVINVLQTPPPFSAGGFRAGGTVETLFGSGDRSSGVDGMLTLESSAAALAISGSRRRAGDLRPGGAIDSRAAVTRFLGIPSTVVSKRLQGTGFEQWGAQLRGRLRAGPSGLFSGFYRRDEQSGVNRYDRIGGGEGLFRSEITPQRLDLGVVRYERASGRVVDGFRASVSINRQQDGTLEQARPAARIDSDRTIATAVGFQGEATKGFRSIDAIFGGDIYDERIDAWRTQTTGAVSTPIRPLIPDGTRFKSGGLFAQAASREIWTRLSLRGGLRYNTYRYETQDNAAFAIHAERLAFHAVTFDSSATIRITPSLRATASVSRGFRAANASDLGAVGVSGGGGFEISPAVAADLHAVVGSTDGADATATAKKAGTLGPESEYAYEAGLRFRKGAASVSATAFDLELFDAIQRRALIFEQPVVGLVVSGREIVRQDSAGRAFIAIDPRPIGTRVNSSRARVRGFDAEGSIRASHGWDGRAYFSMANGRDIGTGAYLRRMAPAMGGVMAGWQRGRTLRLESSITFGSTQTKLSPGDLSDARIGGRRTAATIATFFNGTAADMGLVQNGILRATGETLAQLQARLLNGASESMLYTKEPGWVAFGARAIVPIRRAVDLIVIGENLTDRNYRVIGSGLDAPGANVQVRIRIRLGATASSSAVLPGSRPATPTPSPGSR